MAIVASELLNDSPISATKRSVTARYQDSIGDWHERSWTGPIADAAQWVLDQIPNVEADLADQEIQEALSDAEAGNNPDKVPPTHQTQIEFDRRLIGVLMTQTSVDTLIASLSFWTAQEGRNGNNNNARADNLGVPRPEYIEADARFGDTQGVAGGVTTVNSQVWDEVKDAWL